MYHGQRNETSPRDGDRDAGLSAGFGRSTECCRTSRCRGRRRQSSSARLVWCCLTLGMMWTSGAAAIAEVATATAAAAAGGQVAGGVIPPPALHASISSALSQHDVWTSQSPVDVQLDLRKADPQYTVGGLPKNMTILGNNLTMFYHMGYSYGNTALVRIGGTYVMMVRRSSWYMSDLKYAPWYPQAKPLKHSWLYWWANAALLCSVNPLTLQPESCVDWQPRNWQECWWGQGFEGTGVEDPRLFIWPGKGLYVMFGSKPWPKNPASTSYEGLQCEGPLAFQQWLVLIKPFSNTPPATPDPWMQGIIRLNYVDPLQEPSPDGLRREKNWNPFIYRGKLLFSQMLRPHVVIKPRPDGTCVEVFRTHSSVLDVFKGPVRGNTQAVLVPTTLSGEPINYYLGVMHTEENRSYNNHFYKMQARPPFKIFAVSQPIPLVGSQHPWNKAWTNVSFPMSLDLVPETSQILIGYGSGDTVPRVRVMSFKDMQDMFTTRISEQLKLLGTV